MTLLDERMEQRAAEKAQALGEIASALASIEGAHREPEPWEQLCFLRAFSLVAAGCYNLAAIEAHDMKAPPPASMSKRAEDPVLARCDLSVLFEALKESMEEDARIYPHLGPTALG